MSTDLWGMKDYGNNHMYCRMLPAAKKNDLIGCEYEGDLGLGGDSEIFQYYNPGAADNDLLDETKISAWLRAENFTLDATRRIRGFIFARLQGLGTGYSSAGSAYFLTLGYDNGVTQIGLHREKFYEHGTVLWTDSRILNTWYKLQLSVRTNASGNPVIEVHEDADDNDIWSLLISYEDTSASKIINPGFVGTGFFKGWSTVAGKFWIDDIKLFDVV